MQPEAHATTAVASRQSPKRARREAEGKEGLPSCRFAQPDLCCPRVPKSSLSARLVLLATSTLLASAVGYATYSFLRPPPLAVTIEPGVDDGPVWNDDPTFVVDEVAGFRPRRAMVTRFPMLAVDQSDRRDLVKHRNRDGFLRRDELPSPLDRQAVLMVGDSHLDGVVSTDENVATLLEAQLVAAGAPSYVLNAGCGLYSLWQSVLRARDLLQHHRPAVVVVVVFLGNDFFDLENKTVPHLDDELHELPPGVLTEPETTSARLQELAIPAPYEAAFWQGFNQALYLQQRPERLPILLRKAAHAVDVLEAAGQQHGARIVWALLPSFDLVFPEHAQGLGKVADELVRSGIQRRLRDGFTALLDERKAQVVDFEPAFRTDGKLDLFALDFHVYVRGHRVMADTLREPIRALLQR